jgi:hypothetical protein
MRIPASTSLRTVSEPTLSIDTPEVVPQVTRMARLAVPVVAAERHTGAVVRGDGARAEEEAVAALVGEVTLGYVNTVGRNVSYN